MSQTSILPTLFVTRVPAVEAPTEVVLKWAEQGSPGRVMTCMITAKNQTNQSEWCFICVGPKFSVPGEILHTNHEYQMRASIMTDNTESPVKPIRYSIVSRGQTSFTMGRSSHKEPIRTAARVLLITCTRPKPNNTIITWKAPPEVTADNTWVIVTLTDVTSNQELPSILGGGCQEFRVPSSLLLPAHEYVVEVKLYRLQTLQNQNGRDANDVAGYSLFAKGDAQFWEELTTAQLAEQLEKASRFTRSKRRGFFPCAAFYRNKLDDHFTEIFTKHDGVIKASLKSNNGDPACPINGRLRAICLAVNVNTRTGQPHVSSHYGPKRLSIPSSYMFEQAPNLYFAAFYCIRHWNQAHHVALVMASPGTDADVLCAEKLIKLDVSKNDFLIHDVDTGRVKVTANIWVVILYANDIDLNSVIANHGAQLDRTRYRAIMKNQACKICNPQTF